MDGLEEKSLEPDYIALPNMRQICADLSQNYSRELGANVE
jgi:hypothetical protein